MLTNENYFDKENQLKYMGASQFKAFQKCEAAALAEIRGEYEREKTTALLVGSYVDAHFEGTLDIFKAKNPEIFTKQGALKPNFSQAEYIIQRLEQDELFSLFMGGQKQVIQTGEIAGIPFKIKIDSLLNGDQCREIAKRFPEAADYFGFCEGAVVDLKVMKDFEPIWSAEEHTKIPFIEAWGYDIQGAIYQEINRQNGISPLPFFIAGATKEKETDIAILHIPQDMLDAKLYEVEQMASYYNDLKNGIGEPQRCEKCDYCKRTKKLTRIVDYREV